METRPESYPMSITELMELESEYSIKAYILIKADPRDPVNNARPFYL